MVNRTELQRRIKLLRTLPGYSTMKVQFGRHKFSKEEVITELRRVAKIVGHSPSVLEFTKHGRFTSSVANRVFGPWNNALVAAGLKGRPEAARHNFSEEEVITELRRVAKIVRHSPSVLEFTRHGRFTAAVACRVLGSWSNACMVTGLKRPSDKAVRSRAAYRAWDTKRGRDWRK